MGWKSLLDVFENSFEHKQKVTAMINALYAHAKKEPDYAMLMLMQWCISKQVEKEKSAKLIRATSQEERLVFCLLEANISGRVKYAGWRNTS